MRSFFRLVAVALAALGAGGVVSAQNGNDNLLHNGGGVVYYFTSPSIGFSTGVNPPDFSGHWYWKVYPATSITTSSGASEATGWQVVLLDTDWSTSAAFYDTIFAKGKASTTNPGNIEPDFTDPNAVFLSIGTSGLPNPCIADPSICGGGLCPPTTQLVGYDVAVSLGTCTGDGILFVSDDNTHFTESSFFPGDMFLGGPAGSCGNGDFVFMNDNSTNETQASPTGVTYSFYGGRNFVGVGLTPNPLARNATQHIELCAPTLNIRLGPPVALPIPYGLLTQGETGLAGVNANLTAAGTLQFGYRLYDEDALTQVLPFALATSCVLVPPAPPGIPILGGNVLLNLGDPVTFIALHQGAVLLDDEGAVGVDAFDNGVYESANPATIPIGAVGKTVWSQAFGLRFDAFLNLSLEESNRTKTTFY